MCPHLGKRVESVGMEQTTLKKAVHEDLPDLLALMQAQFDDHAIEYSPAELAHAIGAMLIRNGLGFFILARLEGRPVGLAAISFAWTLEYGGKTAWLDELYVLPEFRGQGIGGLLVDETLCEAKRVGCLAIDLEVETGHERAANLYLRKGFRKLPRSRWACTL